ncbi:MAG: mannose-1-phosphate guanylyltransferase/mannose-6-phosphate isomerase [Myxococcales bacterium]|nr:mannose-1-phosphate guanylyltransferase/mannose-6-phosphate isomerase [Myxococcales bacterium]MCB9717819.1 mannose-1-phosphate guanylyltransferase/mannose-6-phosphate isomerase [Myxococcales bacterium]
MVLVPVILSGGSGTRLWPLSRRQHPKQLQALVGDRTMLQRTVARAEGLPEVGAPLVVCNEAHAELVAAQLRAIERPAAAIVLEPLGRNTAPAVAVAALVARARSPQVEPLLLCLPADHVVHDEAAFREAVVQGLPLAQAGRLVTFGIVPDRPHTGYGYIRAATPGRPGPVEAFVEKPDRSTAEGYLSAGGYYWNSGMFLLRADAFLQELGALRPEILAACERAVAAAERRAGEQWALDRESFAACPSDSIDYAVMEETTRASVVPLDAGWSDVGSWDALHEVSEHDEAGNARVGDVLALDCEGCHLHARHRLVAAVGLHDVVVVETDDAVLVAPRARSEDVKRVVSELDVRGRPEAREHGERWASWGHARRLAGPAGVELWELHVAAGHRVPGPAMDGGQRRVVVVAGRARLEPSPDGVAATLVAGDSVALDGTLALWAEDGELELVAIDRGPS